MKLGAEPKKVGIFVALLAVAGIVYWMNSSPSTPSTATARPLADVVPAAGVAAPVAAEGTGAVVKKRVATGRASITENIYKLPQSVDPSKVDPTLRLDLLAKVQAVEPEGGSRNLFQFSTEPVPQPAAIKGPIPNVPNLHPNAPQPLPPNMASVQRPAPPAGSAAGASHQSQILRLQHQAFGWREEGLLSRR